MRTRLRIPDKTKEKIALFYSLGCSTEFLVKDYRVSKASVRIITQEAHVSGNSKEFNAEHRLRKGIETYLNGNESQRKEIEKNVFDNIAYESVSSIFKSQYFPDSFSTFNHSKYPYCGLLCKLRFLTDENRLSVDLKKITQELVLEKFIKFVESDYIGNPDYVRNPSKCIIDKLIEELYLPLEKAVKPVVDEGLAEICYEDKRIKTILENRYELNEGKFMTLNEIGKKMRPKISREWIYGLEHTGLLRLVGCLKRSKLGDLLREYGVTKPAEPHLYKLHGTFLISYRK